MESVPCVTTTPTTVGSVRASWQAAMMVSRSAKVREEESRRVSSRTSMVRFPANRSATGCTRVVPATVGTSAPVESVVQEIVPPVVMTITLG